MEDKKTWYYVCIGIGVVVLIYVCWYLLREPDVRDQRDSATTVTESLGRAGSEQQSAARDIERVGRELDSSIGRLDEITSRIGDAESSIRESQKRRDECAGIIEDSQSRISESKRILQEIRSGTR